MQAHSALRHGKTRQAASLIAAVVALLGAMLVAPSAAYAAPNPPPKNNGEWDGGPYGGGGTTYTVLELPNGELFSGGMNFAYVVNPANNQPADWAEAIDREIYDAALQPDGKIIVVGLDTINNGPFMARLLYDGTTLVADPTFNPDSALFNQSGGGGALYEVAVLADNSFLVGGTFDSISVELGLDSYSIQGLAKFTSSGYLDRGWTAGTAPGYFPVVIGLDVNATTGDIYASGQNASFGLAKFDSAGALDASFIANAATAYPEFASNATYAVRVLSDGKVLVGVNASTGAPVSSYRMNADGTNDATYVGALLQSVLIMNFYELSNGMYLVSGPTSVQRVLNTGPVDPTWTCGGTPDPVSGCGASNNYPHDVSAGLSFDAIELKNGKILVAHQVGFFRLIAVGKPKVTDVSSGGNKRIKIVAYADVDGTTQVGGGGTKLMGFVIQYNNSARTQLGKANVIWARFIKPPEDGTSTRIVDLTDNQAVATCQSNLIVVGKPNPSCFRSAEIDNNNTSPRTYRVFTMFQDNGSYPLSPFSIYSPGIQGNTLTLQP